MKLYLFDQKRKLAKHFSVIKDKKLLCYNKSSQRFKTSTIQINCNKNIEKLNFDFFFNYKIFPESILIHKAEWNLENRKMESGDTIVQQVYVPPFKSFSQKIIFGVRIKEVVKLSSKKEFSYETLEGHVEKGISIFTIEEVNDSIIFKIQTYSSSGNLLIKLLEPIFSIPYQAYCTKKALLNVKNQIEQQCDS